MDKYLFGLSILLFLVGLLMIYSTTFGDPEFRGLPLRQSVFFLIGLIVLIVFSSLDYRYLLRISWVLYLAALILMVAVLLFGINLKGSVRWFNLGFTQFQPVEFAKLALIVFLAAFFHKRLNQMSNFKNVAAATLAAGIFVFLTLRQPDMGSSLVLLAVWFGLLLASGAKKKHIALLLLICVVLSAAGWFYFLEDYQKARVASFLNPLSDPQGRGYNAIQSITAIGSGGFFGRGFARGVVSQLRFLPERQTDFIFASLAEELGFVGACFLLLLLLIWFLRMARVVKIARENFGFFLSLGIFYYLFIQTAINIGMNVGLLPITGIPLPLVSSGGSSLIASMAAIGILESIIIHAQPVRFD